MEWLNYHHLLYFWTVAKRGSVVAACEELRLRQPTVSAQIQSLEESMGEKLFERVGRKLILTETGKVVYRYADQIFSLGRELVDVIRDRPADRTVELVVGIADVVPKLIAYRLLKYVLSMKEKVRLVCREDRSDRLFAELAIHNIDVVISDGPVGAGANIKAYNHLLGECGVSFMAEPKIAEKYRKGFPQSLSGAPFLMPAENTALRGQIDVWLSSEDLHPSIVGEFEDSALLKMFGMEGGGIFIIPSVIEKEVRKQYEVDVVGRLHSFRERYYLITVSRKIRNPAVAMLSEYAKNHLFVSQ